MENWRKKIEEYKNYPEGSSEKREYDSTVLNEKEFALKYYKDYPERSGGKRIYDSYTLPFNEYLTKYYSNPDLTKWNRWMNKYIEPAFDENRSEEMIKNFGYVSIDKHDFKAQNEIYNQLKTENRLDEQTRKFIGFLAGYGFFKKWNLSIKGWFMMINWHNPYYDITDQKSINQILDYENGLNYLKNQLPEIPFWKR